MTFGVSALGCLAIMATVNFVVNPYGTSPSRYFSPYSWNVRQAKVTQLQQLPSVPQLLILGSSRSFSLSPAYVRLRTGLVSYNASVTSGRMIDFLAFLRFTLSLPTAYRLKVVVLGLDAGSFWPDIVTPMELRATPSLFRYGSAEQSRFSDEFSERFRIIAFSQFLDSLRSIAQARTGRPPNLTVEPDGVVRFEERERQIREGQYDLDSAIDEELPYLRESYGRRWAFSPVHISRFRQIAQLCDQHGIRLVVWLSPEHPRAVAALRDLGWEQDRSQVLDLLRAQRASGLRFDLYDFSTIDRFQGTPDGFINATHVRQSNAEKILERLLAGTGDAVQ